MNEALREIRKKSKSFKEADFLTAVFGEFRNDVVTGAVPFVLFGAGSAGKELYPILRLHGVEPACFCDNNPDRIGKSHCSVPVISVPELCREHRKSLIVVTIGAHGDEVRRQLLDQGLEDARIRTISNREALCYYTHLAQWYWTEEDLLAHGDELLEVYNLLSDQKSRDIFTSRIALFVGGADYESFRDFISKYSDIRHEKGSNFQECMHSTNYDSESYLQFNNDLITLGADEVLVDGGAYTGDSTLEFINACQRNGLTYRKIICFEPDSKIFSELQKNTSRYSNILLRPFGLWSHTSTIQFADSSILRPGSTRIVSVYEKDDDLPGGAPGIIEIQTASIDEDLPGEPVTIIKMDVEGAEMNALQGARKTIERYRPKLIISAYHKRNDLFEIPLLVHRMVPEYKIYFRHFSSNFGETTLFAL